MQEPSIRRRSHESSNAVLLSNKNRSTTSGQVQTDRVSDYNYRHRLQGAFSILMAAEEAKEWNAPLFAAQIDCKKAFGHVDGNEALKAMKKHGVGKQHLEWLQNCGNNNV